MDTPACFMTLLQVIAAVVAIVFGVGAIVYETARFDAGIPGATYRRCVEGNLHAGVIGLTIALGFAAMEAILRPGLFPLLGAIGIGLGVLTAWFTMMRWFPTTPRKAVLVALPAAAAIACASILFLHGIRQDQDIREFARRAVCLTNMSNVGKGIAVYWDGHEDAWPPDLATLVRDGQAPAIMACPSTENNPGTGRFDYFYLPCRTIDANSPGRNGTLVACDFRANHKGKVRSFLCADLYAGQIAEEAFQGMLSDPNNVMFARALRAAESGGR